MDKNQNNLSLENALRIAKLIRPLSPQAKNELFRTKNKGDFQGFQKVAFENRLDPNITWEGIGDLQQQIALGVAIPIDGPRENTPDSKPGGPGAISTAGALAAGIFLDRKEGTYERLQENSDSYGKHAKKIWVEEEKERLKNPDKFKPKPGRAIDEQEAYDRAHREYHEMFSRGDQKKAKK